MDANNAADVIVNTVKKSKLNFYIQESSFSLIINLRKTFIKAKTGLVPASEFLKGEKTAAAIVDEVKVENWKKRILLSVTLLNAWRVKFRKLVVLFMS